MQRTEGTPMIKKNREGATMAYVVYKCLHLGKRWPEGKGWDLKSNANLILLLPRCVTLHRLLNL